MREFFQNHQALFGAKNPFVSTTPHLPSAGRYACGVYLIGTETHENRLYPEYEDGVPKNPSLGKILTLAIPITDLPNLPIWDTYSRKDGIALDARKSCRNEVVFVGKIDGSHVVAEHVLTMPPVESLVNRYSHTRDLSSTRSHTVKERKLGKH